MSEPGRPPAAHVELKRAADPRAEMRRGGPHAQPLAKVASIEKWALPDVAGPVVNRQREDRKNAEMELLRQLQQESEARGYQAGLARAQAEMQPLLEAQAARVRQLDSVAQLIAKPLEQLDAQVERELLQLALAVGKQLARRELRVDPAQVIGIIRESLAQLPAAAREVRVCLHPEDAATVRERLAPAASDRAWSLVEDPTLTRGGCLIRTDTSQIDARLESRISSVIASVLGEERADERPAPAAPEARE